MTLSSAVAVTPTSAEDARDHAVHGPRDQREQLTIMVDEDHSLGYRLMRELNELITRNLTAFAAG